MACFGLCFCKSTPTRSSTNDLWRFDTATNKWFGVDWNAAELSKTTNEEADAGLLEENSTLAPAGRLLGQLVIPEGSDTAWLIGGWNGGLPGCLGGLVGKYEVMYGDVWTMNLNTPEPRWRNVTQDLGPIEFPGTSRFQAASIGAKIYIHNHRCAREGGIIYCIDTETSKLEKISTKGPTPPGGRGLHSMTAVGQKLYVFGGAPQSGQFFDDFYVLDTEIMEWTQLKPTGESPGVRGAQVASCHGSKIYFWGGARRIGKNVEVSMGPLEYGPELYVYDTEADEWQWPEVTGMQRGFVPDGEVIPAAVDCRAPRPGTGMTMVTLDHASLGPCLGLYGGWMPFKETYGETWLLPVKAMENGWTQVACDMEMAPRSGQMAAASGGKMYVLGGYTDSTMWRNAKPPVDFEYISDGTHDKFMAHQV